jgi:hypothetical protein
MPRSTVARAILALAATAGLAGCAADGDTVITRTEVETFYSLTGVTSSIRDGVLPGAIYGTAFPGAEAAKVAAAIRPPSWTAATQVGTGAPRGYRLVLVFNPLQPVNADTLCQTPEAVATTAPGGELRVQGAWCFWDKAATRGYAVSASAPSAEDPRFQAAMGQLMAVLLPSRISYQNTGKVGADFLN